MLYEEYMQKVKDLTIFTDQYTNMCYLAPQYKYILDKHNMYTDLISDHFATEQQIKDALLLQVSKRNTVNNPTYNASKWFINIIDNVLDPKTTQQTNEFIRNLIQYMKMKDRLIDKQKDLQQKQNTLNTKQQIQYVVPGINFSKKTN